MKTAELRSSLLIGLETAKKLTEILNNTLSGAHTLETMCDVDAPDDDKFCSLIGAASMELMDAAGFLAEAVQFATPSQNSLNM